LSDAVSVTDEYLPLRGVRGASFALRVDGSSMADLIQPDDIVIFEKRQPLRDDEICAIRVAEDEVTLKYLRRIDDEYLLTPHNPDYEPFTVPAADVSIEGTYLGLIRGHVASSLLEIAD